MVTNITQYLDKQLKIRKDKLAVADDMHCMTFDQLYVQAIAIATKIQDIGLGCNRPVIVFCPKSIWKYAALLGILYSGNYYIPLDVKMPEERLKMIVALLDAQIAIVNKEMESVFQETGFSGQILTLPETICEEEKYSDNCQWRSHVIDTDPAYVLFTSGSTGVPKGVVISHRAVIDYMEWHCEKFSFDETNILGNQAPFYFDASMPDLYTPLCCGATLHIIPEKLFLFPGRLMEYINEKEINTLIWVPSALMMFTIKNSFAKNRLKHLRLVMFCGEVMPNKHLNQWRHYYPDVRFVNLYGPTEAAYACTYYEVNREFSDSESLPIGKACENTDILVLDEEGNLIQDGREGELCIRGSCLAHGYYGDMQKTEKSFVKNPLNRTYEEKIYRTGDIVRYNEFMELLYVGRRDFQIKHMGYRIELGEIETAAYGMPEMKQCCALYHETQSQILLYCAVANPITEKDIFQFLKTRLPRYMMPARIFIEDSLPLNANGKTDRLLLKSRWET